MLTLSLQSVSAGYKPSPLRYGSPPTVRNSPFRRPESPASPSPLRQTTPTGSPTKTSTLPGALRFARGSTPTSTQDIRPSITQTAPPIMSSLPPRPLPGSPGSGSKPLGHGNALSQLQPAQVRTLRDGFQILDRDCDGVVNREDVADMLNQLGTSPCRSSQC